MSSVRRASCPRCRAAGEGTDPVARQPRARARGRRADARRRAGGPATDACLPPRPGTRLRRRPRRARRATRPRACRPTYTSAASRRARSRTCCRAGKAPRPSAASSAGATSTPSCCCTTRATRAEEFQRALPRRDRLGRRPRRLPRLVRGSHRLPARRRRHAPAAPRGMDAQPRAARRRLVPDQGPRHRLASAASAGSCVWLLDGDEANNNGNWQWIALGRRRPPAGLPPHLQPGPAHGALRPRRRLRPPLRPGACGRARRVPRGAVDDAGGGPARVALRDRRRLPGADRRPPGRAASRRSRATASDPGRR